MLDLEPIKRLLGDAIEGPWGWDYFSDHMQLVCQSGDDQLRGFSVAAIRPFTISDGNAALISHAPTDITALVAEVERMSESLKQIESWTRNPREYVPSTQSIHHLAVVGLGGDNAL